MVKCPLNDFSMFHQKNEEKKKTNLSTIQISQQQKSSKCNKPNLTLFPFHFLRAKDTNREQI